MVDSTDTIDATSFIEYLKRLKQKRKTRKEEQKKLKSKRKQLKKAEKDLILQKTDSRCHICGGTIEDKWQADHVLAHSGGGQHDMNNYLPAHNLCNNYRWDYLPEEFMEILKLGVWSRTQIEMQSKVGKLMLDGYIKYERNRLKRRNSNN